MKKIFILIGLVFLLSACTAVESPSATPTVTPTTTPTVTSSATPIVTPTAMPTETPTETPIEMPPSPPEQLHFSNIEDLEVIKNLYNTSHEDLMDFLYSDPKKAYTSNGLHSPEAVGKFIDIIMPKKIPYLKGYDSFSLICIPTNNIMLISYKKDGIIFDFKTSFCEYKDMGEINFDCPIGITIDTVNGTLTVSDQYKHDNVYVGTIKDSELNFTVRIYRSLNESLALEITDALFSDFSWVTFGDIMDGKVST